MYGKIENGEFQFAPINFITPAGRTIINFHKSPAKLAEYGFLPVTESPIPEYDPETEYPVDHYEQGDGAIIQSWTIEPTEGGE